MGERRVVRGNETLYIDEATGRVLRKYRNQAGAGAQSPTVKQTRKRILCDHAYLLGKAFSDHRMIVAKVRRGEMHQGLIKSITRKNISAKYEGSSLVITLEGGGRFELDDVVELDSI